MVTVFELIGILSRFEPNLEVEVGYGTCCFANDWVDVTGVEREGDKIRITQNDNV